MVIRRQRRHGFMQRMGARMIRSSAPVQPHVERSRIGWHCVGRLSADQRRIGNRIGRMHMDDRLGIASRRYIARCMSISFDGPDPSRTLPSRSTVTIFSGVSLPVPRRSG